MGNRNSSKINSTEAHDDNKRKTKKDIQLQLEYIIMRWYRQCNINTILPKQIINDIIISQYIFQEIFCNEYETPNRRAVRDTSAIKSIKNYDNKQLSYDYRFELICIGEANTGKTSIADKWTKDIFIEQPVPSFRALYNQKIIKVYNECNKKYYSVQLRIWDTCGQERFGTLPSYYFQQKDALLLVYDIIMVND